MTVLEEEQRTREAIVLAGEELARAATIMLDKAGSWRNWTQDERDLANALTAWDATSKE
jgi:hypothetical protein